MTRMAPEERFPFIAGVVEGLAYARYVNDNQQTEGMGCIYDWFYEDESTISTIYAAFDRYPDHMPGTIVATLVNKKCGD